MNRGNLNADDVEDDDSWLREPTFKSPKRFETFATSLPQRTSTAKRKASSISQANKKEQQPKPLDIFTCVVIEDSDDETKEQWVQLAPQPRRSAHPSSSAIGSDRFTMLDGVPIVHEEQTSYFVGIDFGEVYSNFSIACQKGVGSEPARLCFSSNINMSVKRQPTVKELEEFYRVDKNFIRTATLDDWRSRDVELRRRESVLLEEFIRREDLLTLMKKDLTFKKKKEETAANRKPLLSTPLSKAASSSPSSPSSFVTTRGLQWSIAPPVVKALSLSTAVVVTKKDRIAAESAFQKSHPSWFPCTIAEDDDDDDEEIITFKSSSSIKKTPTTTTPTSKKSPSSQPHNKDSNTETSSSPNTKKRKRVEPLGEWIKRTQSQRIQDRWRLFDGDVVNQERRRVFFMRRHLFGPLPSSSSSPTIPIEGNTAMDVATLNDLLTPLWLQPVESEVNAWCCKNDDKYWHLLADWEDTSNNIKLKGLTDTERITNITNALDIYCDFWIESLGIPRIDDVWVEIQAAKFGLDGPKFQKALETFFIMKWGKRFGTNVQGVSSSHKLKIYPLNEEQAHGLTQLGAMKRELWQPIGPTGRLLMSLPSSQVKGGPHDSLKDVKMRAKEVKEKAKLYLDQFFAPERHMKKKIPTTTTAVLPTSDMTEHLSKEYGENDATGKREITKHSSEQQQQQQPDKKPVVVKSPAKRSGGDAASKLKVDKEEEEEDNGKKKKNKKTSDFFAQRNNPRAFYARKTAETKKKPVASLSTVQESPIVLDDDSDVDGQSGVAESNEPQKKKKATTNVAYGHAATSEESASRIANKKEASSRVAIILQPSFDADIYGMNWKMCYTWLCDAGTRWDWSDGFLTLLSQRGRKGVIKEQEEAKQRKIESKKLKATTGNGGIAVKTKKTSAAKKAGVRQKKEVK